MKIFLALIVFIVCRSGLYAQSYPNLFNHYIGSPPSQFVPIESIPKISQRRGTFLHNNRVYEVTTKQIINKDVVINGLQLKVRYYDASSIFKRLRVACLYTNDGVGWKCFMGRFFTQHEEVLGLGIEDADKHVIGLIHPLLANLLVRTINFHPAGVTNRGEWKNIGGVQVTGDPAWVAAHLAHNKHVVVSQLNDRNSGNPLQEIIEANALLDQVELQDALQDAPSNTKSGSFSIDLL
jgi:hypothetical protein